MPVQAEIRDDLLGEVAAPYLLQLLWIALSTYDQVVLSHQLD